jgi:CheY-like chemotaxis protein
MAKDKRILIADDDPRVLLILRAILERMRGGYLVVAAGSGTEALEKIEDRPFDLVITDVRMPGVDGIELVEAIRALNRNTAVIWITAYGCHKLQAECDRLAVHCCLDKPLRIGEIRQAALEALGIDISSEKTDG